MHNDFSYYVLGANDCLLDAYENKPFQSTGGSRQRLNMSVPNYVPYDKAQDYLFGYQNQAQDFYGSAWETI